MGQIQPLQQNKAIDQLTPKQKIFLHHYIQNGFNGSQAYRAIHPECKRAVAEASASRMLANEKIRAALREMCNEALDGDVAILELKIRKALEIIAFSDIGKLMEWDNDGITIFPSKDVDTRPVKSIKMKEKVWEAKNGDKITTVDKKLVMYDSLRALDMLAKILGLYHIVDEKPINVQFVYPPATDIRNGLPSPEENVPN